MRKIILYGKTFGRWFVIPDEHTLVKIKGGVTYWKCRCSCGNENYVARESLLKGLSKSCGCLAKEILRNKVKLPDGEANLNSLYHRYIIQANKRNLSFELTKEEFRILASSDCFYCGQKPEKHGKSKTVSTYFLSNGVDRKDNTKGYIIDNIVPCCYKCNSMKGKLSFEDFIEQIAKINSYMNYNFIRGKVG